MFTKQVYRYAFKRGMRFGFKEGHERGATPKIYKIKDLQKYFNLHEKALNFAILVNQKSYHKFNPPSSKQNLKPVTRGCFFKIGEWAVILHRSVRTLCEYGYVSVGGVLLRSMAECFANMLAILNSKNDCEYMAFRFYALEYLNFMVLNNTNKDPELDQVLNQLDSTNRRNAELYISNFIKQKKQKTWWFRPEFDNVSQIFKDYAPILLDSYKTLSKSTHGTFFGSSLFKDQPDTMNINPRQDLKSIKVALLLSSRYLSEISNGRSQFERLGCDADYNKILQELIGTKKDF